MTPRPVGRARQRRSHDRVGLELLAVERRGEQSTAILRQDEGAVAHDPRVAKDRPEHRRVRVRAESLEGLRRASDRAPRDALRGPQDRHAAGHSHGVDLLNHATHTRPRQQPAGPAGPRTQRRHGRATN